uniref:Fibronectin type-III domain-containing protein n=1 Tax=Macrostomum lignano TaxID=282301 RepID=A0A1I8FJD7_9PLAT
FSFPGGNHRPRPRSVQRFDKTYRNLRRAHLVESEAGRNLQSHAAAIRRLRYQSELRSRNVTIYVTTARLLPPTTPPTKPPPPPQPPRDQNALRRSASRTNSELQRAGCSSSWAATTQLTELPLSKRSCCLPVAVATAAGVPAGQSVQFVGGVNKKIRLGAGDDFDRFVRPCRGTRIPHLAVRQKKSGRSRPGAGLRRQPQRPVSAYIIKWTQPVCIESETTGDLATRQALVQFTHSIQHRAALPTRQQDALAFTIQGLQFNCHYALQVKGITIRARWRSPGTPALHQELQGDSNSRRPVPHVPQDESAGAPANTALHAIAGFRIAWGPAADETGLPGSAASLEPRLDPASSDTSVVDVRESSSTSTTWSPAPSTLVEIQTMSVFGDSRPARLSVATPSANADPQSTTRTSRNSEVQKYINNERFKAGASARPWPALLLLLLVMGRQALPMTEAQWQIGRSHTECNFSITLGLVSVLHLKVLQGRLDGVFGQTEGDAEGSGACGLLLAMAEPAAEGLENFGVNNAPHYRQRVSICSFNDVAARREPDQSRCRRRLLALSSEPTVARVLVVVQHVLCGRRDPWPTWVSAGSDGQRQAPITRKKTVQQQRSNNARASVLIRKQIRRNLKQTGADPSGAVTKRSQQSPTDASPDPAGTPAAAKSRVHIEPAQHVDMPTTATRRPPCATPASGHDGPLVSFGVVLLALQHRQGVVCRVQTSSRADVETAAASTMQCPAAGGQHWRAFLPELGGRAELVHVWIEILVGVAPEMYICGITRRVGQWRKFKR